MHNRYRHGHGGYPTLNERGYISHQSRYGRYPSHRIGTAKALMDGELLAPLLKEALVEIFHRFIPISNTTSHPKLLAFCMGQKDSDSTAIDFFRDPLFDSSVIKNIDVFLDESASWNGQALARYLETVNARDVKARATAIMTRYGERHLLFHRSKASKFISEGSLRRGTCERSLEKKPAMYFTLNLTGFLQMYKDACKDRPVAVRSDLRESGYDHQLQRM